MNAKRLPVCRMLSQAEMQVLTEHLHRAKEEQVQVVRNDLGYDREPMAPPEDYRDDDPVTRGRSDLRALCIGVAIGLLAGGLLKLIF